MGRVGSVDFVPYGGPPLTSRQKLSWRVRFRDESGKESDWSSSARFELGLLSSDDWKAQWIRPQGEADPEERIRGLFASRIYCLGKSLARPPVCDSEGLYEVYLNGRRSEKDAFTPGWTSYAKRIDTQTYDVTESVHDGGNALGAMLGYGWYAGHLGWKGDRSIYGEAARTTAAVGNHFSGWQDGNDRFGWFMAGDTRRADPCVEHLRWRNLRCPQRDARLEQVRIRCQSDHAQSDHAQSDHAQSDHDQSDHDQSDHDQSDHAISNAKWSPVAARRTRFRQADAQALHACPKD